MDVETLPAERYSLVARLLHWSVATLVAVQLALGWLAQAQNDRGKSFVLLQSHYDVGITIFALVLLRILWRSTHGATPIAVPMAWWQGVLAAFVHALLYVSLLTLPISGYVLWVWMDAPMDVFGLIEVPKLFVPVAGQYRSETIAWNVHHYTSWAICALLALHIAAAAWHEFVVRDGLISRRML